MKSHSAAILLGLTLFANAACSEDTRPAPSGDDEEEQTRDDDDAKEGLGGRMDDDGDDSDGGTPSDGGMPGGPDDTEADASASAEDDDDADDDDNDELPGEADARAPTPRTGELSPGPESVSSGEDGVPLGEFQPGLDIATVCLHVDVDRATYAVVPDSDVPAANYEPVLTFVYREAGATLYAAAPWFIDWGDNEDPPETWPLDEVQSVHVLREGAGLQIDFELLTSGPRLIKVEFE